ncbi:hypothetical protein HORIV_24830 [Vreelandella olivaria]|uniref:Pyrrolo-quinoline quinone repeat domain-containing protein n=1 Tax=Vreelandella olivaria TaxID=390919 RepID=A0ABN5WVX0_9GAMM|nr:hypothetical protein HORIV_24830 [Halomonas olivaria]
MPILLSAPSTPFKFATSGLGAATALAVCFTSLPLLAQEPSVDTQQSTVQEPSGEQASPGEQENAAPEEATSTAPIPLVPGEPTWDSFHGQLNAQKYSPLDQINADNVGELEKVWEVHTGDVADGSGDLPATVWSATPVFANDTLYIGTPSTGSWP